MASKNKKNKAKNSYFHNGAEKVTCKGKRFFYFNKKQRNVNKKNDLIEAEEQTQEESTLLVCRNIFYNFCQEYDIKGTFKEYAKEDGVICCLCYTELIDKSRFGYNPLKAFSSFLLFIYIDNPESAIDTLAAHCNIILKQYGTEGECKYEKYF